MAENLIAVPGTFGENGNFLIEREIGAGGMGGVYMGRDKMLDRPVAVKIMLKELGSDAAFVERFKREAQAVAKLIHPNIAQVYSYGISDGMPYMAMELVAGGSLDRIMANAPGKTDVKRIMKIGEQLAQALRCATDLGIVHGDVKPENVLLDANGNAKLVDFGLAAMQKDTEEIWGTPYYIAPEKVKKQPVDFRADMYSLGGTIYHALTGVPPFEGTDANEVVKKRFLETPKKPSELRPGLSPQIDALVMQMLARDREERFPSFEAVLEAFKEVMASGLSNTAKMNLTSSIALTGKLPTGGGAEKKPAAGGKKTLKTGKHMVMKKKGSVSFKKPSATMEAAAEAAKKAAAAEEDEEESGGHLGTKVFAAIFGGIALIAAVIGGLVWYQVADKNARAAEERAQIVQGIATARGAIADTANAAVRFADEFDAFAAKAIEACERPTEQLIKILPPEEVEGIKPPPTKELIDAIESTNEVLKAEREAAKAKAEEEAKAAATNKVKKVEKVEEVKAEKPKKKIRHVKTVDEEEEEAMNGGPAKEEEEEAEEKKPAPAPAPVVEAPKPKRMQDVIATMAELWGRAYGCQASAIRIRVQVNEIVKRAAEADEIKEETRANMEKLGEMSREVVEMLDKVKGSKDVENVKKGIGFIKSKGEKTVAGTVKRLRIEKLEADRKAKAEAEAKAEQERKERLAAERKALVESEQQAAKDLFDTLLAEGAFRQLDWKGALRRLEVLKAEAKTPEGEFACDAEILKVKNMQCLHDLLVKNLQNYTFKRGKLRGQKNEGTDDKELRLYNPNSKVRTKTKITWMTFYKEYHGNLNEIIIQFAEKGREGADRLTLRQWADAMCGAALTMRLICNDDAAAMTRGEAIARKVAAEYPDLKPKLKEMFADIDFDAETEAAE